MGRPGAREFLRAVTGAHLQPHRPVARPTHHRDVEGEHCRLLLTATLVCEVEVREGRNFVLRLLFELEAQRLIKDTFDDALV